MQLGPKERRVGIGRGVLPDPALRAAEPADVKAVQLDQGSRVFGDDVPDRLEPALRLRGTGVPRDQRQPLAAGLQAVPAEHPGDPVVADAHPAPALLAQRVRDPPGAHARIAEGEGDDLLLEERRQLVGHPR